MEYGDISLHRLISVYKMAYQKAGFRVTKFKEKYDTEQTVRLRMVFLPFVNSKKQKASFELSIHSTEGSKTSSNSICKPCSVFDEAYNADSDELERKMEHARSAADHQINKKLSNYLWYDPADGVFPSFTIYDRVSVLDFISAYKKAYAESGFELKEMTLQKDRDGKETRYLIFRLVTPDDPKYESISLLVLDSPSTYWCDPCYVLRETTIRSPSALDKESEEKDAKARKLAEVKLANYLRVRARRDITTYGRE